MTILEVGETRHWTYRGTRCRLSKNGMGNWTGYVQTKLGAVDQDTVSDVEGREYQSLVEVHGGITYGTDTDGWVGFDCGHARDVCLNEKGDLFGGVAEANDIIDRAPIALKQAGSIEAAEESDEYNVWRMADVKEETERLADQVILLERFVAAQS